MVATLTQQFNAALQAQTIDEMKALLAPIVTSVKMPMMLRVLTFIQMETMK
jgi:hypothetical protein